MRTPLYRLSLCTMIFGAILLSASSSPAQQAVTTAPVSVVPHLIKFSGALPGASNKAETVDVKFSLYAAQTGGEALWTETQQVSLDPSGKYSVLLGSVAALPDSAFAQGQARWIGVTLGSEQESARTILVATPYSLKASDSETLGGHPASDFTLKNALPASGTDITQINVGSGITGGGTGPTVTLGLSSSYLESLGNNIYPQIAGTNTMTGKNTYTAGKLLIGSSPVLSTANIIAGSEVVLSTSGSNVTVGVNGPGLLKLANGYYPQLGTANSFTGNNTFTTNLEINGALSSGQIYVLSPLTGSYALVGNNESGTASSNITGGVAGLGLTRGVYGFSTDTSANPAAGVFGITSGSNISDTGVYGAAPQGTSATGVYGVAVNSSNEGSGFVGSDQVTQGVWGDGPSETPSYVPVGVLGTTDDGIAGIFANNSPSGHWTLAVQNDDTTGKASPLLVLNTFTGTLCTIDGDSNFSCDGSYTSTHAVEGRKLSTFSVQSAENWIEDAGGSQLSSGHAHITLDAAFLGTVNTGVDYRVFLTPNGDSKGLYVISKQSGSFDVVESGGGHSNISFDYRIMAKRKGSESARLTDVTVRSYKNRLVTGRKTAARPTVQRRPPDLAVPMAHPLPVAAVHQQSIEK